MKKKILVVDDSKTALFMVTTILKKGALRPRHGPRRPAGRGGRGRRAARPDPHGRDHAPQDRASRPAASCKQREDTKRIPVILVTTRGEEENVETGFESGCNDYVTKPVNAQELLAKVRDHIAG